MIVGSDDDDERAHSRRYTEDGINVVALARHGRDLHRARPERRFPTGRLTAPVEPQRSWLATAILVVLVLAALGVVLVRASG